MVGTGSRSSRRSTLWGAGAALSVSVVAVVVLATAGGASTTPRARLEKLPMSGGVLMARALRSGAIKLPHAAPAAPGITIFPNVVASASGSNPVNEDPITANPSNSNQLESGGNDYSCSSLQGFYNSDDAGATWRRHCMPVTGAGGCGDPNVAYDLNNNGYILGIGNCNGSTGNVVFQKTTDNGVTWGPATTAFSSLLGGLTDKEWTEIDTHAGSPFANCIYVSWTDFNAGFTQTRASVAHSCDQGATWTRVAVDSTRTVPNIDQFTDLAVGDNGTVYLTWMRCKVSGPAGDCGNTGVDMYFSKSTDGGNTWTTPAVFASAQTTPDSTFGCYYGCFPGSSERLSNIPVIDVDSAGKLNAVYYTYTGGKATLKYTSSTDGGTTWTAALTVNGNNHNQGWAWLSVDDVGHIGISYMDSGVNGSYNELGSFSKNGLSFAAKTLSTATSSFANDGFGGTFIGDYTGNIWSGVFHASWMDTRSGGHSVDMTGGVGP